MPVDQPNNNESELQTCQVREIKKSWKSDQDVKTHQFQTHRVYGDSVLTDEIFRDIVEPLIPFALKGGFANVMAYGQTGSGKSHTLSQCSRLVGSVLFQHDLSDISVAVSCLELYGQNINDLLTRPASALPVNAIGEDVQGKVQFRSSEINVKSSEELVNAFELAWASRHTHATEKNEQSSRSHAIIRISLTSKRDLNAAVGILQLIDLAGSERASSDSIHHSKERLKETVFINKTLMTLKDCIRQRTIVSPTSNPHIPYRGSKLTLCLKESFELSSIQPSHTVFLATVSPLFDDVSASVNTLRYASSLVVATKKIALESSNEEDVSFWSNEQVLNWLAKSCGSVLNPKSVAPFENGISLSKVPENDFIKRIITSSNGKIGEKRARGIYLDFWNLVIEERTRKRDNERKTWAKQHRKKVKEDEESFAKTMSNYV